jgi:hypothetical protein
VGLALVLLYAGISDARWVYRALRDSLAARKGDEITQFERRVRALRPWLPDTGVVGYTDGVNPSEYQRTDFQRFVLTQYALAPLLVVNTTEPEVVVGNFRPEIDPRNRVPPGLRAVRDLGDGLVVFRRTSR